MFIYTIIQNTFSGVGVQANFPVLSSPYTPNYLILFSPRTLLVSQSCGRTSRGRAGTVFLLSCSTAALPPSGMVFLLASPPPDRASFSTVILATRLMAVKRRHWRRQKARARYMMDMGPRGEVKVKPTWIRLD